MSPALGPSERVLAWGDGYEGTDPRFIFLPAAGLLALVLALRLASHGVGPWVASPVILLLVLVARLRLASPRFLVVTDRRAFLLDASAMGRPRRVLAAEEVDPGRLLVSRGFAMRTVTYRFGDRRRRLHFPLLTFGEVREIEAAIRREPPGVDAQGAVGPGQPS